MLEYIEKVFTLEDVAKTFDLVDLHPKKYCEDGDPFAGDFEDDCFNKILEDRVNKFKRAVFAINSCPKLKRRLVDAVNEYWFFLNNLVGIAGHYKTGQHATTDGYVGLSIKEVETRRQKIIKQFQRVESLDMSESTDLFSILTSGLFVIKRNKQ